MKTLLLSVFALTMAHVSFAQINKGALLVGAGINFNHSNNTSLNAGSQNYDVKNTSFSLYPSVGYFTNDNFMIGMGLGYSYSGLKDDSNDPNSTPYINNRNEFSVNPYVRKYIEISEKLYFRLGASASAGMGSVKRGETAGELKKAMDIFSLGVSISPGLTYFLTPKWALYAQYGNVYYAYEHNKIYSTNNSEFDRESDQNRFGASLSLNSFGLGIQYFLRNE